MIPTFKSVKTSDKTAAVASMAAKEAAAQMQKERDEKEREKLMSRIDSIFRTPILRAKLSAEMKPPSEKTSLADLRLLNAKINSQMNHEAKVRMVHQFYDISCNTTEQILTNYMRMEEKAGLGMFLMERKKDLLEQELAEIAAELPDDYVPGAKTRLLITLISLIQTYDVRTINSNVEEKNEL